MELTYYRVDPDAVLFKNKQGYVILGAIRYARGWCLQAPADIAEYLPQVWFENFNDLIEYVGSRLIITASA